MLQSVTFAYFLFIHKTLAHPSPGLHFSKSLQTIFSIFKDKVCYAIVRNHMHLDIIEPSIPSVIHYFNWENYEEHGNSANYYKKRPARCYSKYIVTTPRRRIPFHCVSIQHNKWVLAGRPGNCKLVIDFAFSSVHASGNYPKSEQIAWIGLQSIPEIHILIPIVQASLNNFKSLVSAWSSTKHSYLRTTNRAKGQEYVAIGIGSRPVKAYRVTYTGKRFAPIMELIPISDWDQMKQTDLKEFGQATNEQLREWHIFEDKMGAWNLISRVSTQLRKCEIDLQQKFDLEKALMVEVRSLKLSMAHAYILKLLMRNFTYYIKNYDFCNHPGTITKEGNLYNY